MIDQRLLPGEEHWSAYRGAADVAEAIRAMVIRGAPAIGIAAAYGVVVGVRDAVAAGSWGDASRKELFETLANTRPTAVNLFWALERMGALLEATGLEGDALVRRLFEEAEEIRQEDRRNNLRMGRFGADLLPHRARVLTHCNTGGLATGGYGTALGVLRAAHGAGKLAQVWIDETRPYLQGARLTAWECMKDGLPSTLITDSMAAHFMQRGQVDAVIVGADRISANGDAANKIGTYGLAVSCNYHNVPFYVAAPKSTIDRSITNGEAIPIEQRSAEEVTHVRGVAIAPEGVQVAHPAFDVTPAELVTAIITEEGVLRAPYSEAMSRLFER
ncbi:MAG: S-methyl-5-thioribose-1-phosphate isomerase [Myxococcota bacterium]